MAQLRRLTLSPALSQNSRWVPCAEAHRSRIAPVGATRPFVPCLTFVPCDRRWAPRDPSDRATRRRELRAAYANHRAALREERSLAELRLHVRRKARSTLAQR